MLKKRTLVSFLVLCLMVTFVVAPTAALGKVVQKDMSKAALTSAELVQYCSAADAAAGLPDMTAGASDTVTIIAWTAGILLAVGLIIWGLEDD